MSGIRVSSIAFPRASQSDAESKPNGSLDLMREANARSADEESLLELAVMGTVGDDADSYRPKFPRYHGNTAEMSQRTHTR